MKAAPSALRLSLPLIMVLMVISSPIVLLVNPAVLAKTDSAPSSPLPTISTIPTAPSTIGQDGKEGDYSTQAALTSPSTKQTNNIVNTQSEFAVTFKTSTTGVIKKILVTFPAGTNIGAVNLLITREGIGPGAAEKTSSTTIAYTVDSAVSVPAGTLIKLEFGTVVNSPNPGNQFVTVTTRTASNAIIDGPTAIGYSLKQIGTGDIADGAVTTGKIATGAVTTGDIAEGAVTGSKIQGVQKLLFAECILPAEGSTLPGQSTTVVSCSVPGTEIGDDVLALYLGQSKTIFFFNFEVDAGQALTNEVELTVNNDSPAPVTLDNQVFSIIVFKK